MCREQKAGRSIGKSCLRERRKEEGGWGVGRDRGGGGNKRWEGEVGEGLEGV